MFLIGSASQKNITVLNIFKAEMKKTSTHKQSKFASLEY